MIDPQWVAVALTAICAGCAGVVTVAQMGVKLELSDLKAEIAARLAADKAELMKAIDGGHLRAAVVEAQIGQLDRRVSASEAELKELRTELKELRAML
jgi:hypothetical protein